MQKHAQVSVFLITVAVLLIAAGFLSINSNQKNKSKNYADTDQLTLDPVSNLVETCIRDTLSDGIFHISMQGGYYHPPDSQQYLEYDVPFYLNNEQFKVPTTNTIEDELALYMQENLAQCIDDFESLQGFDIRQSQASLKPIIGENEISVLAVYPLEIHQGDSTKSIEQFSVSIPFDFKEVYSIVQQLMVQQGEDTLAVHYGALAQSAYEHDYYFEIIQVDEQTVIYSLRFDSKSADGQPYVFNFAARYAWE